MESRVECEAVVYVVYENEHDENNGVNDGDNDDAFINATIYNNEINDGGYDDFERQY